MNSLKSNKELNITKLIEVMKDKCYTSLFSFDTIIITNNDGTQREEMGLVITFQHELDMYRTLKSPNFIFLKSKENGWKWRLAHTDAIHEDLPINLVRNINLFPVLPTWFVMNLKRQIYQQEPSKKKKTIHFFR